MGAAAVIAAVFTAAGSSDHSDARAGTTTSSAPTVTPSSRPTSPASTSASRQVPTQRQSAQPSPRTSVSSQPSSPAGPAGGPWTSDTAAAGSFRLTVAMRSGTIATDVAPISVASHEAVDPPHYTVQQWNTAAWVQQSTFPATPARGTSYVYGHACHYHVCPFTNLKDAQVGDQVRVTVSGGVRSYTIVRTGLSPKSASSLPSWASDSTVPNRIVLVTCAYEQGDTSINNIVVVARLTSG